MQIHVNKVIEFKVGSTIYQKLDPNWKDIVDTIVEHEFLKSDTMFNDWMYVFSSRDIEDGDNTADVFSITFLTENKFASRRSFLITYEFDDNTPKESIVVICAY